MIPTPACGKPSPPYKPTYLRSYLCKLARRIALDRYRHDHRQKRLPKEALLSLDEEMPVSASQDEEDLSAAIDSFLDTLPKEERVLFVRRYFFGESVASLAERFSLGENRLAVRFFRMRENLKKYLLKKGFPL